jgi:hypothetical protein
MRILSLLLAAFALSAALPAAAQTLKPGLWEMQHKVGGNARMDQAMAEMQQQMAAMPPDQRKQMEAMMAGRGVQMGRAGDGAMAMKICMTKEMVERNDIPANQGDCKTTQKQRSGNTLNVAFTCTNPPSKGDSQITFNGSESYTMKTNVTSTVDGNPETMTMEGRGRWLSADCGAIKPIQPGK